MTSNKKVLAFIEETKALCDPKEVVWVDGSESQLEAFRKQAVEEGILIKLNQELLPGCYLHRTTQNDVAREPLSAPRIRTILRRSTTGWKRAKRTIC